MPWPHLYTITLSYQTRTMASGSSALTWKIDALNALATSIHPHTFIPDSHNCLWIIGINMENRRIEGLGHIRAIGWGTRKFRIRCKPDLIVDLAKIVKYGCRFKNYPNFINTKYSPKTTVDHAYHNMDCSTWSVIWEIGQGLLNKKEHDIMNYYIKETCILNIHHCFVDHALTRKSSITMHQNPEHDI